jgi:hypothetical protein
MTKKTILEHALEYYRRDWCIIPVGYKTKKPPLVKWTEYQINRPSEKQIQKWFSHSANIAVVLGDVSDGLCCRDFDGNAGITEYHNWSQSYPDLAKQLAIVKTGNGFHIYFEASVKGIKHYKDKQGNKLGELRGAGGYCLLPPSIHPDGVEYQWINPPNGKILAIDPKLAGIIPNVTERAERTEEKRRDSSEIEVEGCVENAINRTLPTEYGTRHRKIFLFARTLKSMAQFSGVEPVEFRSVIIEWHKRALPNVRTKEFDETWTDFCLGWEKVKHLIGDEPMGHIFKKAKQIKPPKIALELYPGNKNLHLFVALCKELQKEAGQTPFFLDCRTGARYLNVTPMTISRWFQTLGFDKVVRLVKKGGIVEVKRKDGTVKKVRMASRYRYIA